jgi:hypothetical protein
MRVRFGSGDGRAALPAILVLALAACGGGGSGADVPAGTDPGSTADVDGADVVADVPVADRAGADDSPDTAIVDEVGGPDAADVAPADTVVNDAVDAVDAAEPAWDKGLPSTGLLGTRRGLSVARAIIHMHNIYSHDACDGKPRLDDGSPNEACHQQLRAALCTDHIDFAMMTDHTGFVEETDTFSDLYMPHAGDSWEDGTDGQHSANRFTCDDGHDVRFLVGMEGEASPIGIKHHPVDGDRAARSAAYSDVSAEGVQRLRDAGAVPVVIHIEDRSDAWLDAVDLDLFETCNLHILLHPAIREVVGLEPNAAAAAFADWVGNPWDHSSAADLVFLEFHQRVDYYMDQWDRQLGLRMMGGFAGNDVHQNVMAMEMADGERPDGYRRMMKWYVNHLLVDARTGDAARAALHARRLYEVFEVLGTPADFDFRADGPEGAAFEMGEVVPAGTAVTLRAPVPGVLGGKAGDDLVRMVLIRATPEGAQTVYDGPGPVEVANPAPGRYRLEVFLTPYHLEPWLKPTAPQLLKEYPWVYSNPIEVR